MKQPIDDEELERLSIKDGEIDPERYSPKNAGCLKLSLTIIGLVLGAIKILVWLAKG